MIHLSKRQRVPFLAFTVLVVTLVVWGDSNTSAETSREADTPTILTGRQVRAEPTSTPEPTSIPPTQGPRSIGKLGKSRSNPFPQSEVVSFPDLTVQVVDVVRGDEAWQVIQSMSEDNDPAPEGREYLLVKLHAKSICDAKGEEICPVRFAATGDKKTRYGRASGYGVAPIAVIESHLDVRFLEKKAGETEGWLAFIVDQGEGDLILVVESGKQLQFIALEEGASVGVPPELADIQPASTGRDRADPVPLGEMGITEDWEITILEVARGDDAWAAVQEAGATVRFPSPQALDKERELVAVRARARYISTEDAPQMIDSRFFNMTGDANILYQLYGAEPSFGIGTQLYPGGVHEGWMFGQAAQGEADLMAVFYHFFSDEERVFFALEGGTLAGVPPELQGIKPTDLGKERDNPAPLGEKVSAENWQVTILQVVRGDDAWAIKEKVDRGPGQVYPPDEGMEYVAFKVRVRYIGTEEEPVRGSAHHFNVTGGAGELYTPEYIYSPFHLNGIYLSPDGQYEEWLVFEVAADEKGLVVVFEPPPSLSSKDKRYLSLENGMRTRTVGWITAAAFGAVGLVLVVIVALRRKREMRIARERTNL